MEQPTKFVFAGRQYSLVWVPACYFGEKAHWRIFSPTGGAPSCRRAGGLEICCFWGGFDHPSRVVSMKYLVTRCGQTYTKTFYEEWLNDDTAEDARRDDAWGEDFSIVAPVEPQAATDRGPLEA